MYDIWWLYGFLACHQGYFMYSFKALLTFSLNSVDDKSFCAAGA